MIAHSGGHVRPGAFPTRCLCQPLSLTREQSKVPSTQPHRFQWRHRAPCHLVRPERQQVTRERRGETTGRPSGHTLRHRRLARSPHGGHAHIPCSCPIPRCCLNDGISLSLRYAYDHSNLRASSGNITGIPSRGPWRFSSVGSSIENASSRSAMLITVPASAATSLPAPDEGENGSAERLRPPWPSTSSALPPC
jgi:hypothetical protein